MIGLPVAFLLGAGYLGGMLVGWLFLALAAGSILVGLVRKGRPWHPSWAFLLGLVVLYVLTRLPFLGGLVTFVGLSFGLGAFLIALYRTWRGGRRAPGPQRLPPQRDPRPGPDLTRPACSAPALLSPPAPAVAPPFVLRSVVGALLAGFLYLGLSVGAQGVLWAEVVQALGIGKGAFGAAQLVPPLVAICLLLRGGPLSARLGKRRLAVASLLALGGASLILALAPTWPHLGSGFWALVVALAVLGAGMGLFETAVNGAAMDWESEQRAPPPQRPPRRLQRGGRGGGHRGRAAARPRLAPGRDPPPPGPPRPGPGRGHPGRLLPGPGRPPAGTTPRAPQVPRLRCGSLFRGPLLLLAAIAALGSVGESVANLWSVIYLSELGAGAWPAGRPSPWPTRRCSPGGCSTPPWWPATGPGPPCSSPAPGCCWPQGSCCSPAYP